MGMLGMQCEWETEKMSLKTLRVLMWSSMAAAIGCGFFMAYSVMCIAAAMFFFVVFMVLALTVGFKDGLIAKRASWIDSSREDTWKTK
jgi:hypothetical protein